MGLQATGYWERRLWGGAAATCLIVQRARFCTGAGSASESLAALRVAVAWGYLEAEEAAVSSSLLRRVLAILWKLQQR
jgi:hypothetical protein